MRAAMLCWTLPTTHAPLRLRPVRKPIIKLTRGPRPQPRIPKRSSVFPQALTTWRVIERERAWPSAPALEAQLLHVEWHETDAKEDTHHVGVLHSNGHLLTVKTCATLRVVEVKRSRGRRPLVANPHPQQPNGTHAAGSVLVCPQSSNDLVRCGLRQCGTIGCESRGTTLEGLAPKKHVGLVSCDLRTFANFARSTATPAFGRCLHSISCESVRLHQPNKRTASACAISACWSQTDTTAPAESLNHFPAAKDIWCTTGRDPRLQQVRRGLLLKEAASLCHMSSQCLRRPLTCEGESSSTPRAGLSQRWHASCRLSVHTL